MSHPKPCRDERSVQRRASILEAARIVFAKQGYAETVVDDIATQASIAKGTLYLYFPSKEEIYIQAMLEDMRLLDKSSQQEMDSYEGMHDKLRAFMQAGLRYVEANPAFFRILLAEFGGRCVRPGQASHELDTLCRTYHLKVAVAIRAAVEKGEVPLVDADLMAQLVADSMRGLIERRILGWDHHNNNKDAEIVYELLWRALSNCEAVPLSEPARNVRHVTQMQQNSA